MSTSDKGKETPKVNPAMFPPITPGAPGGEWSPPPLEKDVAVLWPSKGNEPLIRRGPGHLWEVHIPGLDAKYVLAADGSTRPYGEGH